MERFELENNLIHIRFDDTEEMCMTFLRFQEYYESPEFKGKIFTLDEFKEWYNDGDFTYTKDWFGFNIPSHILEPFREGLFDPLSDREKKFLELLPDEGKFYIVGTTRGINERLALEHEMRHALFYTNNEYRKEVTKYCLSKNLKNIYEFLDDLGYHPDVFVDEAQAYIGADYESIVDDVKVAKVWHTDINKIYNKYTKVLTNEN